MEAGDDLHLIDEPGPVALHREVDRHVAAVGADGRDDPHRPVVHRAPLVLGGRHAGLDPHPVSDLDGLAAGQRQGLGEELDVDVADPVGSALALPGHLRTKPWKVCKTSLLHYSLVFSYLLLQCNRTIAKKTRNKIAGV